MVNAVGPLAGVELGEGEGLTGGGQAELAGIGLCAGEGVPGAGVEGRARGGDLELVAEELGVVDLGLEGAAQAEGDGGGGRGADELGVVMYRH